jgi:hypothetical protein
MRKIVGLLFIAALLSTQVMAQGRLGSKLLDKLAPPPKQEEQPQPVDVKTTPDGYSITTEDGTVTIEDAQAGDFQPNTFLGSFTMNIQTTEKGKTENSRIEYHFQKWQTSLKPTVEGQQETMQMIFNLQNQKMSILTTDKKGAKTGIITKMPKVEFKSNKLDDKIEQSIDNTTFKRTGEKKNISGYSCEKWIITNPEGVTEAWITDEIDFNMANAFSMFSAGSKGKGSSKTSGFEDLTGFALESTFTDTKGAVTKMTVSDIKIGNPSDAHFSTAGYTMTDLSSFGGMFGR